MDDRHWTESQFIAELYGIGPGDDHLSRCIRCTEQLAAYRVRRNSLVTRMPQPGDEFFIAQRHAIQARLNQADRLRSPFHIQLRPLTALAGILLLLVIASIFRPLPKSKPKELVQEDKLFEEVYSLATTSEPQAVEPVKFVFEVNQ